MIKVINLQSETSELIENRDTKIILQIKQLNIEPDLLILQNYTGRNQIRHTELGIYC